MRALVLGAALLLTACTQEAETAPDAPDTSNIAQWVYVADGGIQCEDAPVQSLEEGKEALARIAGADHIVAAEKRSMMVIQMCGAPTGHLNAYGLTEDGWFILSRGFAGPGPFSPWVE